MATLGRTFVVLGVIFILIGGLFSLAARVNLPFGRLPGDIAVERENARFYFPLATSLIISLVLTLMLNLALRLWRR